MDKPLYITTTLPYVNDNPHMGHALEFIQADCLARAHRINGGRVFFTTGTDEHGQKIFQKAQDSDKDVREYVDHYAERFKMLKSLLNVSYDNFIRTTDDDHVRAAQEMWRRCNKKGDIYKKKYVGKYCVGDEAFVKESDLVDGKCPNHPTMEPQEIEEENYFFRLSAYQQPLLDYLRCEDVIIPPWRRKEAIAFVEQGLEDVSISREKERMSWGIPVPDDETQVMYVWFDALTNYISTLGWPDDSEGNFATFWKEGETIQIAGKDQVRFQSIMWQAMLLSADLPTTDRVFYHGFITSGGQKMSKSIGNVINPVEVVDEYGLDALRYYLLREIPSHDDGDFTWQNFHETYTANLVNGLGNLVSRVMTMAVNYDVEIDFSDEDEHGSKSTRVLKEKVDTALASFHFDHAMDHIWARIGELDAFITAEEPFKKIKVDEDGAKKDIEYLVKEVWAVGVVLEPFLPQTAQEIVKLTERRERPAEPLFPRREQRT